MSKANLPIDMFYNGRTYEQMTQRIIDKMVLPNYRKALKNIDDDLAKIFAKHAKKGKLSWAEITQYNRLATLEKDIQKEIANLSRSQQAVTRNAIKNVYEESYYRTAFALENASGAALGFGKLPKHQVLAAIHNPLDRIGWGNRTSVHMATANVRIRGAITQGIIQGQDYNQISKNIGTIAGKSANDIRRIVNTETARARSMGTYAALQRAHAKGLNIKKKWVSAMDERTRDSHALLDGQTVGMEEKFISGFGNEAEAPRMFGIAEEDINCRCQMIGEFPGHEFDQRRYRYEDTPDSYVGRYSTYPQWMQKKGLRPHIETGKWTGPPRTKPWDAGMTEFEKEWHGYGREIADQEFETMVLWDNQNKFLTAVDGQAHQVTWIPQPGELARMRGGTTLHNHPSGRSFSVVDIVSAQEMGIAKEIVYSNKFIYTMEPPVGGWTPGKYRWPTWGKGVTGDIDKIAHNCTEKARATLMDEIRRGIKNIGQANEDLAHYRWLEFAKVTGVKYTRVAR